MADARPLRQARLRERLRREGLAGLIVTHIHNVRYLTGFTGSAGVVLIAPSETVLVTDTRYEAQAPREVGELARTEVVRAELWERVGREVIADCRLQSGGCGVEAESVTVATQRKLADLGLKDLKPVTGLVEDLRAVKDTNEVDAWWLADVRDSQPPNMTTDTTTRVRSQPRSPRKRRVTRSSRPPRNSRTSRLARAKRASRRKLEA